MTRHHALWLDEFLGCRGRSVTPYVPLPTVGWRVRLACSEAWRGAVTKGRETGAHGTRHDARPLSKKHKGTEPGSKIPILST